MPSIEDTGSEQGARAAGNPQNTVMRWVMAGHEIVPERGTFRHRKFKHDLAPDTPIKIDGQPVIQFGKEVLAKHLLPERIDLGIDGAGNVMSQDDFTKRYRTYLMEYEFVSATDINCEPVPNVRTWVLQEPDPISETNGTRPVHFDPKTMKPGEWKATQLFGINGEPEDELRMKRAQDDQRIDKLVSALGKLAGVDEQEILTPDAIEAEIERRVAERLAPPLAEGEVRAYCGASVAEEHINRHQAQCKKCNAPDEAA